EDQPPQTPRHLPPPVRASRAFGDQPLVKEDLPGQNQSTHGEQPEHTVRSLRRLLLEAGPGEPAPARPRALDRGSRRAPFGRSRMRPPGTRLRRFRGRLGMSGRPNSTFDRPSGFTYLRRVAGAGPLTAPAPKVPLADRRGFHFIAILRPSERSFADMI